MSSLPERASTSNSASSDPDIGKTLDDLFRHEGPRLQRYFRRRLRPGEDVLDYVQEAFLRLTGAAVRTLPAQPAAYLQRIARNLLIDRSRRVRVVGEMDANDVAARPEQEDALLLEDVMALYEATLHRLPERTKSIFLLYRVDGLPYRVIAEQMGISITAVQKHVAKALEQLTIALQDGE